MGTDRSRSYYRALAFHDHRLTSIWAAQSSYTEAGLAAGDPVPDQTTIEVDLAASGDQTAAVYLTTQRSGYPDSGWSSGGFAYRLTGADEWRGWWIPHALVGWESVQWQTAAGSPCGPTNVATTRDESEVVTVYLQTVAALPKIQVDIRNASTGAWTQSTIATYSATAPCSHPAIICLPSGRLLVAYVVTTATVIQVATHYSDDRGATWTLLRRPCLSAAGDGSTYAVERLRMVYLDGQVGLFATFNAGGTRSAWQWVSYDYGASFDLVDTLTDHDSGSAHGTVTGPFGIDVAASNGQIVWCAGYANTVGAVQWSTPEWRILGACDQPLSSAAPYMDPNAYAGPISSIALAIDADGSIYTYVSCSYLAALAWVGAFGYVVQSTDGGVSWASTGNSDRTALGLATWWDPADNDTYPTGLSAVFHRGRVIMMHNWEANPGTYGPSIGAMYLGGYSNVTLPGVEAYPTDLRGCSWQRTWLPYDLPGDVGWVAAGAGAELLTAGQLALTTIANAISYTRNPTGTILEGYHVRAAFRVAAGGSIAADHVAIRLRLADGVNDYDVSFRAGTAGVDCYDNNTAASLGTVAVDTTGGVEIMIAFAGNGLKAWYRIRSQAEDHVWILGWDVVPTTDAGAPDPNNMIAWGHLAVSASTSGWYEMHYTGDEYTGVQLVYRTFPDELYARSYSASSSCYVANGLRLAASDGPAKAGETWTSTPAALYRVENILSTTQESPRRGWRNAAHNVIETIALALDDTPNECWIDTDVVVLSVFQTNLHTIQLQGYDVGVGWVTLGTLNTYAGMLGLDWERRGDTVRGDPTNSGTDNPYLLRGDLDGGSFRGDTDDGDHVVHIHHNAEGRFGPNPAGGKVRRAVVHLDKIGSVGASGTAGRLYAPRGTIAVKLNGATYAGYRLRLPAQFTADGDYRIGTIILGPALVWGWDPGWDRSIDTSSGMEVTERRDRSRATYRAGPPARLIEVSWPDGVDTTDALADDTPDYVLASTNANAEAIATPADVGWLLEGILMQQDMGPGCYIPRLAKAGATPVMLSREEMVLGYMAGSVRRETVLGEEFSTEVIRIASIPWQEIP